MKSFIFDKYNSIINLRRISSSIISYPKKVFRGKPRFIWFMFVYDFQAVPVCSTWRTEPNGMHGRLLKVKVNVNHLRDSPKANTISISDFLDNLTHTHKQNLFLTGKSKDEAMGDYITKVKQLMEQAGMAVWEHFIFLQFLSNSMLESSQDFENKQLHCLICYCLLDMLLWVQEIYLYKVDFF